MLYICAHFLSKNGGESGNSGTFAVCERKKSFFVFPLHQLQNHRTYRSYHHRLSFLNLPDGSKFVFPGLHQTHTCNPSVTPIQ